MMEAGRSYIRWMREFRQGGEDPEAQSGRGPTVWTEIQPLSPQAVRLFHASAGSRVESVQTLTSASLVAVGLR